VYVLLDDHKGPIVLQDPILFTIRLDFVKDFLFDFMRSHVTIVIGLFVNHSGERYQAVVFLYHAMVVDTVHVLVVAQAPELVIEVFYGKLILQILEGVTTIGGFESDNLVVFAATHSWKLAALIVDIEGHCFPRLLLILICIIILIVDVRLLFMLAVLLELDDLGLVHVAQV
jgi:hypothetical protein